MANQLSLFDVQQAPIFDDLAPHIVQRFWEFHAANLHIFKLFVQYTEQLRKAGRTRYGIGSIAERIRWHVAVETFDADFKLNNNYRSCYARLMILNDPTLTGFFSLRESPGSIELNKITR